MARILIVDDSIVMRRNLEKIFVDAGHEVVGQAINGMQSVLLYSELNPDIVTMDITMPIMSGVDAVSYIINKDPDASIIMISAINQKHMVFQAIKNGAKHYVIKPIDKEVLLRTINDVIKENETQKQREQEVNKNRELGFSVCNANGVFVFVFNTNLSLRDLVPIETAITGLLFIKPLSIIFDFNSLEDINDRVLLPILKTGEKIKKSNGTIRYIAENQALLSRIEDAKND
jgi:YesN/AraC family two-component response regulator